MRKFLSTSFSLFIIIWGCDSSRPQQGIEYTNGYWFNGSSFHKKVVYVVDGKLTSTKPIRIDTTINLNEGYVISPFGDAHTHNLDRQWQLAFLPQQYLDEGTFYAQCLTCKQDGANNARSYFDSDSTMDVLYSQQGITSTLGHPFLAYEPFEMGLGYDEWEENMELIKSSRLDENNSYIFIDSVSQVDEKLQYLFDAKPDMAKIYLLDIENFEKNSKTGKAGLHGLSPEVARMVVAKIDSVGLPIYAHIETAGDFEFAIDIGIDVFAHMPGYNWDGGEEDEELYRVSDDLIKQAVKNNISLIPDVGVSLQQNSADSLSKVEYIKGLIRTYYDSGGKVLAGTDMFNATLSREIEALYSLRVFSNTELLNILSKDTPQAMYPDRKIGELKDGYEASFLVLEENPLEDFWAIKNIKLRVKQGIHLD